MPCGYDAELAYREAEMHHDELATLGAGEVVAVDAAAYFSGPGHGSWTGWSCWPTSSP